MLMKDREYWIILIHAIKDTSQTELKHVDKGYVYSRSGIRQLVKDSVAFIKYMYWLII